MKIMWYLGATSLVLITLAGRAGAAPIEISEAAGYLHAGGSLIQQLDRSSPAFVSTLDGLNLGTFGWTFTNTSATAWHDVTFLAFLDADIDRSINTFFNEVGAFVGLAVPPSAAPGAVAASSWEIDEPGFLFGDIIAHLQAGSLDNSNSVGSAAPDDVSLALGFALGTIPPGAKVQITLVNSLANIGGLRQTDPDSGYAFYLNGSATVTAVPQPSLGALLALASLAAYRRHRSHQHR